MLHPTMQPTIMIPKQHSLSTMLPVQMRDKISNVLSRSVSVGYALLKVWTVLLTRRWNGTLYECGGGGMTVAIISLQLAATGFEAT